MSRVYVGNDIVDLGQHRTEGRATDERFVGRVFDADEQAAIADADDADLELWTRWAAKEAGFKVVSKLLGAPPPFVHRAFSVEWSGYGQGQETSEDRVVREGHVTHVEHRARVSVFLRPGSVHAVAFGSTLGPLSEDEPLQPRVVPLESPESHWTGPLDVLKARFTPRELDAVYSLQSAAVRLGARAHLADALGVDEKRLEIVCDPGPASQRPPRVLLDGARAEADVSLSHDGRWIAWVLWVDTRTENR